MRVDMSHFRLSHQALPSSLAQEMGSLVYEELVFQSQHSDYDRFILVQPWIIYSQRPMPLLYRNPLYLCGLQSDTWQVCPSWEAF